MPPRVPATARFGRPGRRVPRRTRAPIRASLVSLSPRQVPPGLLFQGKHYLWGTFKCWEERVDRSDEVVLGLTAAEERELQEHGCLKQQCEAKCEPSDEETCSGHGQPSSGAGRPLTTPYGLVTAGTRRSQRLNLEMACERSHWAVDATVKRSTKTEFTISIIDTSTDRWKATKLITRKGTIWKMQDKMTSGVSVPEVLNKVKRKASLVSKLKWDREEQEKNKQAALQPRIGRKLNEVEEKMACKSSHHTAGADDKRSTKTKVTVMDTGTEGWKPRIGCKLDDAEGRMACKSTHWAANANSERSANTDVTVIDTSSDEWKSSCSEPAPEG